MTENDENRSSIIKIVDKRRFTSEGLAREGVTREDPRKPTVPAAATEATAKRHAQKDKRATGGSTVDFMTFIASLATSALASLGALPEGRARGIPPDPQVAREYIEVIAMLQEKTEGNLNDEESASLTRLLSELRAHYVQVTQGPKPGVPQAAAGQPGLPRPPGR